MSENKKPYKVKSNAFEFAVDDHTVDSADFVFVNPTEFHLIKDFQSYHIQLLESSRDAKKVRLEVAGEEYEVEIKDDLDQMLEQMGFGKATTKHIKEIKAPMPGMVLEINVVEGQEVQEGEKILILGAMKMENSIMIHAAATIKRIAVKPGQAVEKGQVLVELA